MSNEQDYHLAAYIKRGGKYYIGTNSTDCSLKFRRYRDGIMECRVHAEMAVLRWTKPGDVVHVMRFLKDGTVTMAMPCKFCQYFMRFHGIRKVRYTNWEGQWETMKL